MRHWPDRQSLTADIQVIQSALGDFFNRRGQPVYGRNSAGEWIRLSRIRLDRGVAYGEGGEGAAFVLREARIGLPSDA
jgi:hypothetical protein